MKDIKTVLNPTALQALEQYEALPDKMKMKSGNPSVPADLIDLLPLGTWVAAKLDWQSATTVSDTVSDREKPNFGKIWFQFIVPCEISGKTAQLRLWYNEIGAALAASEGNTLVVARFETENKTTPARPYQNLSWRNGAPAAANAVSPVPALAN